MVKLSENEKDLVREFEHEWEGNIVELINKWPGNIKGIMTACAKKRGQKRYDWLEDMVKPEDEEEEYAEEEVRPARKVRSLKSTAAEILSSQWYLMNCPGMSNVNGVKRFIDFLARRGTTVDKLTEGQEALWLKILNTYEEWEEE